MENALNEYVLRRIGADAAINVVMVYSDAHAGKRAIHAYDRLLDRFGKQADFNSAFVRFDALGSSGSRAQAIRELKRADIIVVAAASEQDLPEHVGQSIERLSREAVNKRKAVVALLEAQEANRTGSFQFPLERCTRNSRMAFFRVNERAGCQRAGLDQRPRTSNSLMDLFLQAPKRTAMTCAA